MPSKSFIEDDFPVGDVSAESVRENNIKQGHIKTLHMWWARRPLAASRATIYAALIPEPKNDMERSERVKFISELSKWENSNSARIMRKAREDILEANQGVPPKVIDPFSGGGSIPLEALRLGCETYASDLNPVAVLIEKATLEYAQKYGKPQMVEKENRMGEVAINPLAEDVKKWGAYVLEEARKEIGQVYPPDSDGSVPLAYIWSRVIKCNNPSCGAEIPLIGSLWLAKKDKRKVAMRIVVNKDNSPPKIDVDIVEGKEIDFKPEEGTIAGSNVVCPACYSGIESSVVRKEAKAGNLGERLLVVVLVKEGERGKIYRAAGLDDQKAYEDSKRMLDLKRRELEKKWNIEPLPTELIATPPEEIAVSDELPFFVHLQLVLYGLYRFSDLFNDRQMLGLLTIAEKTRDAYEKILVESKEEDYAKGVVAYLTLAFGRLLSRSANQCVWHHGSEGVEKVFAMQNMSKQWRYAESNILQTRNVAGYPKNLETIVKVLGELSDHMQPATVGQFSALNLPYPDKSITAAITDPPYYDNVPYADLSDFFYVWFKRILGGIFPDLFATPECPRNHECIENSGLLRRTRKLDRTESNLFGVKNRETYEEMIKQAFSEVERVLTDDGISIIVFAHKSTAAWEAIINAILDSGLYITATWPINTEKRERMRAKEVAALASSIYMVCRKRKDGKVAYFNEIKAGIEKRIHEKLDQFWEEGIGGSDFFISAIGPAVEIFGKYGRVEKLSGEQVMVSELLEYVRKVVSEYALSRILEKPQLGGIDIEARFYLLWRWTYNNAKLPFDDARKLSQAVGIELTEYWNKGFVKKEKEFIRVLSANERGSNFLKLPPANMVDVLHQALLLWAKNDRKAISEHLSRTGHIGNDDFWRLAQAIAEVLPEGDREKQMLQAFLFGKENYTKAGPVTSAEQESLFE